MFSEPGCPCSRDKAPNTAYPPPPGVPQTAAEVALPVPEQAAERTPARGHLARQLGRGFDDVTAPARRTHAHCAQHEGCRSDQVMWH